MERNTMRHENTHERKLSSGMGNLWSLTFLQQNRTFLFNLQNCYIKLTSYFITGDEIVQFQQSCAS